MPKRLIQPAERPYRSERRLLMVAYHFPPLAGSSGIQRTLRFVQHLPRFGWEPLVLTASPIAYERTSTDLDLEVPQGTTVRRAFALDAARHMAVGGRYIKTLAQPDRWASWRFAAVRLGMRMIRDLRPHAIWSTYPIATAHVIGAELQRRTGLPWIADFRDPMAQDGYPADRDTWRRFQSIEQAAMKQARWCMFTTPSASRSYKQRYPAAATRVVTLENGYDEDSFVAAEIAMPEPLPLHPGTLTLLHSGIVYPQERDPTQLFSALGQLKAQSRLRPGKLKLRFRAPVHDDLLRSMAARYGVEDLVELLPPVPYREALQEMRRADALLVMQAANCNEQIPAKLYEYLRARRPIVCLSDPAGDTFNVLVRAGVNLVARLDDAQDIAAVLLRLVSCSAKPALANPHCVAAASRERRTEQLAGWLARLQPES